MLPYKKFFSCIVLILFVFAPSLVVAETIAPELYVSSKGVADIRGAQVVAIHALNLISVGIWGQKWTVSMDYTTKFQSSDGIEIKPEQIAVGHTLEIKATPSKQQQGVLEAMLIRDLSLGAGSVASSGGSLLDFICHAPPIPSPIGASATSSALLMRTIGLGTKGADVKILQEFLQKKGLGIPNDGPVTGFFGKVTETAVKKFQEANGLEAIGSIGAKTRAIINSLLTIH